MTVQLKLDSSHMVTVVSAYAPAVEITSGLRGSFLRQSRQYRVRHHQRRLNQTPGFQWDLSDRVGQDYRMWSDTTG